MRVPNFVTVLGVRLCMIRDGLVALYQIPAAIFKAKGASLKEKAQAAFQDPRFFRLGFRLLRASFLSQFRSVSRANYSTQTSIQIAARRS